MKVLRLLSVGSVLFVLVFLGMAARASTVAEPAAGPCAPGASYDPACDVDRNNTIDVADIQLVAGHWNQNGVWVSDNGHNHLGQNWVGASNPLELSGSYAGPDYAPLVLSNSYGLGHGLSIESTGLSGVDINAAGEDGVYVHTAGSVGMTTQSGEANGFEVAGAAGNGLFVGRAGEFGVEVNWASMDGVRVTEAGDDGVHVSDAGDDGIQLGGGAAFPTYGLFVPEPGTAGSTLILNTAQGSGEWALITPDKIQAANVTAEGYTLLAVVAPGQRLAPGDLVSAAGMAEPFAGSVRPLPQVRLAGVDASAVVGVVESRMALQPAPGKDGLELLHSVDGSARAGDYVALTVLGVARVKVDPASDIAPGQRLVASEVLGQARALRSVEVDGVRLAEDAPAVGVALAAVDRATGLVWALVNVR